ncbi:MAG: DMT family transporter [Calditrichaeota bacterium]|nr:DMT family transporter [Calditrichota bacterium]
MTLVHFKLLLTAILWGGTFIAGRIIAQEIKPFSAAFLRFVCASLFLLIFITRKEGKLLFPGWKTLGLLTLLGLTGIFSYNFFFFSGLKHINAGRAAIIIATNPIFITLLSVIFFREKISWLKILGILISVSGAILVISRGHIQDIASRIGKGEVFIFLCVFSWVIYSLLGKVVMVKISPLLAVTYSSLIGSFLLFFPSMEESLFSQIEKYSLVAWFSILYLGFFGTVLGFLWYYEGIKKIGPMKSSIFINFVPISAILLSFFLLGEPLSSVLFFGAIMVIAGIYLTNTSKFRERQRI